MVRAAIGVREGSWYFEIDCLSHSGNVRYQFNPPQNEIMSGWAGLQKRGMSRHLLAMISIATVIETRREPNSILVEDWPMVNPMVLFNFIVLIF
jgi:hypothetical protein